MVEVQVESRKLGGFLCVYNILARIHQCIKVEETMSEFIKHKKYLVILKMSEYEAITVYTFLVVVPSSFGVNRTTKSDINYLPTYEKWRDKSFHIGLGYDLDKMVDPIHGDIKLIISEQCQRHPSLKALSTDMALVYVEFFLPLVHWFDDTYDSLLYGGNINEDVWWINTRVIR